MRHGETDWNRAHKLQGRTDIPLNENGKRAAGECGRKLAQVPFGLCITSPLKRARETAALILMENKFPKPEQKTDARIIEYCFGDWEGKINKGPGYELPVPEYGCYWQSLEEDIRVPGMEGKENLVRRVREFLNELTDRYGNEEINILVVAHGGVLRAVKVITDDDTNTFHIRVPDNCGLILLEPDPQASEAQAEKGIVPGMLKYGRRLKERKGIGENSETCGVFPF